jgi:hypothetical protein
MLPVFEICNEQSLKCQKKIQFFFLHVDLYILCFHKVGSQENNIFILCVEKTNFGVKIGVARDNFFVFFYTRHKKYRFSTKLGACIWNIERYVLNFSFRF